MIRCAQKQSTRSPTTTERNRKTASPQTLQQHGRSVGNVPDQIQEDLDGPFDLDERLLDEIRALLRNREACDGRYSKRRRTE